MPPLTPRNDLVRARNVSASEVYALLGKHPYTDPLKIWMRLTNYPGFLVDAQSEAMLLGIEFEKPIAQYASRKLGVKLRANTKTHELREARLCATPDYYILGQHGLLEVKLSSIMYGWADDTLHPHYEYQARAQMAVTGREFVLFAVLVGSRFFSPIVTRDLEKERRMLNAVAEFFALYVDTGIAPPSEDTRLIARIESGG